MKSCTEQPVQAEGTSSPEFSAEHRSKITDASKWTRKEPNASQMITPTEIDSIGATLSHYYHPELLKLAVSQHFSQKLMAHYAASTGANFASLIQAIDDSIMARVRELGFERSDYKAACSGVTQAGDTVRYLDSIPG